MKNYLTLIFVIQIAVFATVLLDVSVARQAIGFINISFVPGFLVLKILRLNPKSKTNTLLLSVGLSIAFVIFVGLAINELYPIFGISNPLSEISLLSTISTILLIMIYVNHKSGDQECSFSLPSKDQVIRVLPLIGIALLAVSGAMLASSPILLLFVLAVMVLVIITIFSRRLLPFKLYPILILILAVSFMFHREFFSNYLQGYDLLSEFYVCRLTYNNSIWSPTSLITSHTLLLEYNGMLSVTILPTVFSRLMNIQGEFIFKYGYLLFYSLVPLSVYQIYKQGFGKPIAFLSAFYFMLFPRFYSEERRQIIGEIFLILSILVILNRNINPRKKTILLTIFGASLVVSHYSMSYIFILLILSVLAFLFIMTKLGSTTWKMVKKLGLTARKMVKKPSVNLSFILLIIILNFLWYVFVSPSEGQVLLNFVIHVVTSFATSFSSVGTRGEEISEFIAPEFGSMTLVYQVDYWINKIPYFLIVIGFILLIRNYKKMELQMEYLPMAAVALSILLSALILPAFAPAFLAHRFFHVSLLLLSPVCIYGGVTLTRWAMKPFRKKKHSLSIGLYLVCMLLLVVLLFKIGFISEVTGEVPNNPSLSFVRMKESDFPNVRGGLYEAYIPAQEVYSASWLNYATESSKIYADQTASFHVLRAYGMRVAEWKYILSNQTTIEPNTYVYLRYFNVQGWFKDGNRFSNFTVISSQLDFTNKIYSNGNSEIFYSFPIVA